MKIMHKVMFAAALAVGLITAPMPQLISSAAAQQQASAPDKSAKTKKDASAGQVAARERQKKCGAEWKEAKAGNRKERPGRNSGVPATSVSSPLPNKTRRRFLERARYNEHQIKHQKD
jgi:hypothetical protein